MAIKYVCDLCDRQINSLAKVNNEYPDIVHGIHHTTTITKEIRNRIIAIKVSFEIKDKDNLRGQYLEGDICFRCFELHFFSGQKEGA
jgi:hypothetical protein